MRFHLSVNAKGLVSLWDREEQAKNVSEEVYVPLELTREQEQIIKLATKLAQYVEDMATPEPPCPGCGCTAGSGRTPGCTHPDGCGYWDAFEKEGNPVDPRM